MPTKPSSMTQLRALARKKGLNIDEGLVSLRITIYVCGITENIASVSATNLSKIGQRRVIKGILEAL